MKEEEENKITLTSSLKKDVIEVFNYTDRINDTIDQKISTFLGFLVVGFILFIFNIKLDVDYGVLGKGIIILSLVVFLFASYQGLRGYWISNRKGGPDTEILRDYVRKAKTKDDIINYNFGIVKSYIGSIRNETEINEEKNSRFKRMLWLLILGIFLLFINYVYLLFFVI